MNSKGFVLGLIKSPLEKSLTSFGAVNKIHRTDDQLLSQCTSATRAYLDSSSSKSSLLKLLHSSKDLGSLGSAISAFDVQGNDLVRLSFVGLGPTQEKDDKFTLLNASRHAVC
jgi:hypothetical protein